MSMISEVFSESAAKVTGQIMTGLDELFTSDDERAKAQNAIMKIFADLESNTQQNVTARAQADMSSDSKLAKNIRPAILIVTTVLLVSVSFGSMFGIEISEKLYDLIYMVNGMTYGFYFGSRGLEKITGILRGSQ